jgi:hypothetical protein
VKAGGSHNDLGGFSPIGSIMPDVLKEVSLRCDLRSRLEAEGGRSLTDEEFLKIAEKDGLII